MEWKTVKLGEIGEVVGGATPLTKNPVYYDGEISWITPKDLANYSDRYISRGERNITEEGYKSCSCKMLPKGSVLFSSRAPIGYIAIAENDLCTNQGFKSIIPNAAMVDNVFLFYLLKQYKDYIAGLGSGTTFMEVSGSVMKNIELPLPPLETQRRIAAILSSLDDKIENNNRINANLEAQAQALFKSWFVDFEPWSGTMPEDWKEGTLGEIVSVKRGGSPRPIQDYLSDKGYRWLKISDATAEASPFISLIVEHIKEEGLNKTVFIKQGSLVLSNSATPGLPKFVDLDTCIHDGWLYFPLSYFSNEYLYLLFQRERPYLLSQGNGSVFTNLKTDIVKNLFVIIPTERVLNSFQQIVGKVFTEILNNQRESAHLATLRDTLLPKLIKGEIEVA